MKRLFKKVLAMTLSVALTASAAPISYAAGDGGDVEPTYWSDLYEADSSYVTPGNNEFASDSESIYSNEYHVKNAEQLISAMTADYEYTKIILDNDIDMLGAEGRI